VGFLLTGLLHLTHRLRVAPPGGPPWTTTTARCSRRLLPCESVSLLYLFRPCASVRFKAAQAGATLCVLALLALNSYRRHCPPEKPGSILSGAQCQKMAMVSLPSCEAHMALAPLCRWEWLRTRTAGYRRWRPSRARACRTLRRRRCSEGWSPFDGGTVTTLHNMGWSGWWCCMWLGRVLSGETG